MRGYGPPISRIAMPNHPLAKICGITRQEDAELALELGADALGFVLEPSSKRSIHENAEALAIPSRLGPYTLCVAVLGPYRPVPRQFHLIQSVGSVPERVFRPSLLSLQLRPEDTVESVLSKIGNRSSVQLDGFAADKYGGTGHTVNWELVAEVITRSNAKIVLAGGLTPDNVAKAIEITRPYAVDVSGGVEKGPGIKDPAKLKAFLEAVKG